MATVQTPKIEKIFKVTEFDILRTSVHMGNMYICVDSLKMYYDGGDLPRDRQVYTYTGVRTVNDLFNEITPERGVTYYCWEDNSLWYWNNKWISLYSETTYPSAYNYDTIPTPSNPSEISPIYRYDMPNMPADDNGLLKDGSVVVRDRNRLIKGRIYVSDDNDNLIISSYLGGGVRFLPNGKTSTQGELWIGDVYRNVGGEQIPLGLATLRAELTVLNNEIYVNYAENPSNDTSKYQNPEHIYKVYHEGNLDTSAIEVMTPQQVYEKLLDDSLPSVLDFNVKQLQGHNADYFARKSHTHQSSDISDLYNTVVEQSGVAVKSIFNTIDGHGVTGSFNTVTNVLTLRANDFNLSFSGGATGSTRITELGDSVVQLTVDPDKHSHTDYITRMDSLQTQIDNIVIDTSSTYTRSVIDQKIADVTGTTTPVSGKPLLVNVEGILPAKSSQTKQLDHYIDIAITGAITGTTRLNGSETSLTINTELGSSALIEDMILAQLNQRAISTIIGDGASTTFTVRHNLNTNQIIVQFRDVTTGEEIHIPNKILDLDRIQIDSNTIISNGGVQVMIYKIA